MNIVGVANFSTLILYSKTAEKYEKFLFVVLYVVEMAEQLNTMSSIKLGRFQSQIEMSCMSSHTEELWYNETVSLWMTIYIYIYI